MFSRKKIIFICLSFFILTNAYGAGKKIIASASFTTSSKNASIISFVKSLNKSADKNKAFFENVTMISRKTVDERIKTLSGNSKLNLAEKSMFSSLGKSFAADVVVAGDVRFIAESYSLQLQAIIFDSKRNRKIKMIIKTGRFEMRDALVTDFLNSISISIKKHFGFGNKSFSESVVRISNKNEVVVGVKKIPLTARQTFIETSTRKVSLDLIFRYNLIPTILGETNSSNYLGGDIILNFENKLSALGLGVKLRSSSALELDLFYEFHFFRNKYDRHFQIYMRLGPGILYPLSSAVQIDYKASAAMGFRFSFLFFIFDLGAGVDYFMNQDYSFFASGGVGLHF